ncbi:hypothetical protein Taro_045843 [Colocasia esculenta]|uniref:Homeobox domain-containing protein n=1 Tax=Colocasia esculenta TaxID=4460 RepID=A0A843X3C1_COLES|nr:hypothetical protein [Colocasia esculenta]
MQDQTPDTTVSDRGATGDREVPVAAEPVRSRWTPKPEQILILESIFNSGMVNPPKDETVRIRKLLEKFGPVGDANVFYWFQNRRSRSRRRQRQMQAGLVAGDPRVNTSAAPGVVLKTSGAIPYEATASSTSSASSSNNSFSGGFVSPSAAVVIPTSCCSSSFMADDGADDLFSISRQMGFPGTIGVPIFSPPSSSNLHNYHPGGCNMAKSQDFKHDAYYMCVVAGPVTVFINGMAQEVPRGPIDMRAVFGQDMMLVHSSGELVPMTDYGILYQGLHAGESYFLVSFMNTSPLTLIKVLHN